jgi:hypothetical protein
MPFQIIMQTYEKNIQCTIIDEGTSVSILSSSALQAIGSPPLVLVTHNLMAFNRKTSEPLGILPQLPITLEGKIVCIDVMVVQGLLDSNFLLG